MKLGPGFSWLWIRPVSEFLWTQWLTFWLNNDRTFLDQCSSCATTSLNWPLPVTCRSKTSLWHVTGNRVTMQFYTLKSLFFTTYFLLSENVGSDYLFYCQILTYTVHITGHVCLCLYLLKHVLLSSVILFSSPPLPQCSIPFFVPTFAPCLSVSFLTWANERHSDVSNVCYI
jgi:hypothetical protein